MLSDPLSHPKAPWNRESTDALGKKSPSYFPRGSLEECTLVIGSRDGPSWEICSGPRTATRLTRTEAGADQASLSRHAPGVATAPQPCTLRTPLPSHGLSPLGKPQQHTAQESPAHPSTLLTDTQENFRAKATGLGRGWPQDVMAEPEVAALEWPLRYLATGSAEPSAGPGPYPAQRAQHGSGAQPSGTMAGGM